MAVEREHGCARIAARLGAGQKLIERRFDEVAPGLGGALRLAVIEQGSLRG
jgi:hypothetical protein